VEALQESEVKLENSFSHDRLVTVISFLTSLMPNTFSSWRNDKLVKSEIRSIFVSQMAKNLMSFAAMSSASPPSSTSSTRAQMTNSARMLLNYGPVWLLARFLLLNSSSELQETKDPVVGIGQRKRKYWRQQSAHMVKMLMLECQSQGRQGASSSDFVLWKHL